VEEEAHKLHLHILVLLFCSGFRIPEGLLVGTFGLCYGGLLARSGGEGGLYGGHCGLRGSLG